MKLKIGFLIGAILMSINVFADADLKQVLSDFSSKKITLVDIREMNEVSEGMVDGALFLPKSSFDQKGADWNSFLTKNTKEKVIYMYCRSGNRVNIVSEQLKAQGYKIENLKGFEGLKAAGFPVKKGP